jgi:acetoin utilization deacetylase AcuC-like enzyme
MSRRSLIMFFKLIFACCVLYLQDVYDVPLPATHRFPMVKYRMVRQGLQRKLGTGPATFEVSPLISNDDLVLTHEPSYVQRFLNNELTPAENRNIGVSCSAEWPLLVVQKRSDIYLPLRITMFLLLC